MVSEGLPPPEGRTAAVLVADGFVFYAAMNQGVFRSHDSGITWTEMRLEWPAARPRVHDLVMAREG